MSFKTEQEKFWAGQFGHEYIDRNKSDEMKFAKVGLWNEILKAANGVYSIRELGCNIGINLEAIHSVLPQAKLEGYDINTEAVAIAEKLPYVEVKNGTILEPIAGSCDLVLTCTVLIHIDPEHRHAVYDNLVHGSNRYVVVAEYYNPIPVEVNYRGHSGKLFKRDFAGEIMDKYGLKLVDYGFWYRRDNRGSLDDITWFLLEK